MRYVRDDVQPETEEEARAFRAGIEAVLRIRCLKHRDVPAYNADPITGDECAACAVEQAEAERDQAWTQLNALNAQIHDLSHPNCQMLLRDKERAEAELTRRGGSSQPNDGLLLVTVQDLRAEVTGLRAERDGLEKFVISHEETITRLGKALEPFAAAADAMEDSSKDDWALWSRTGLKEARITLGDCRRARVALRGEAP